MSMNLNLRNILESNKLIGLNFSDWVRNLRIMLRSEKALFVLDEVASEVPPMDGPNEVLENYNRYRNAEEVATCLMLASMSPDLQKQHEHMNAQEIHNINLNSMQSFGSNPTLRTDLNATFRMNTTNGTATNAVKGSKHGKKATCGKKSM